MMGEVVYYARRAQAPIFAAAAFWIWPSQTVPFVCGVCDAHALAACRTIGEAIGARMRCVRHGAPRF